MNLWTVFPEALLSIRGILFLPYLTMPFYLFVFYTLFKQPIYRRQLFVFITLTAAASLTMVFSLGPRIGVIIPPLFLLSVMFFPLLILIQQIRAKRTIGIRIWSITTIAGWLHSLSWVVWLFALARS